MQKIIINTPIWATRSVGIDERKITDDIEVIINYKDRFGNKVFPGKYRMEKDRALAYPGRTFGNTPVLKIIPISAFEYVEK